MKIIKTLLLLSIIAFISPIKAEDRVHRCDSIDVEQYPNDYKACIRSETLRGLREDARDGRVPEDNDKVTDFPMDNASECSFSDDRTSIVCPDGTVYSVSNRQVNGSRELFNNYHAGQPYNAGGLGASFGTGTYQALGF